MDEFYDPAVSGGDPVESRPGFIAMLKRIEGMASARSSWRPRAGLRAT